MQKAFGSRGSKEREAATIAVNGASNSPANRALVNAEHFSGSRVRRARLWAPMLLTVVADASAMAMAMVLGFTVAKWVIPGLLSPPLVDPVSHAVAGALSVPLWIIVFARYHLYTPRHIISRLWELKRLSNALISSLLMTAAASFLLRLPISRAWLVLCFPFGVIAILSERELVRRLFASLRRKGHLHTRVIVVGTNPEALRLGALLQRDPSLGCEVVGFVAPEEDGAPLPDDAKVLGKVGDLADLLALTAATRVLIATTAVNCDTSNRLARQLTDAGIEVELSSALRDIRPERLLVTSLGSHPVIYVEPVRRGGWRAVAKRVFDVVLAASALAVLSPVLAVVALAVKLDSPGPVLFRQLRVGKDGRLFPVYKFRTMVVDAERRLKELADRNEADGPLFKIRHDPRITRVGRPLRAFSIDELPQLWNVLRNEMSIVGPRPALPIEMRGWSPELHQRLRVKPGLTGMWQVSGRVDLSFEEYMRLDLYYVDNWSLWTDLAIMAKTLPIILRGKGGY